MKKKMFTVLFVEDDSFDRDLIGRAVQRTAQAVKVQFASCGDEAKMYLAGTGEFADRERFPYPSFMSTDLKMPHGDGFSVLDFLQRTTDLARVPVVVLSGSTDQEDVKLSYSLGASAFLEKPSQFNELLKIMGLMLEFWFHCQTPPIDAQGKWLDGKSDGKLGARFDTRGYY